MIEIRRLEEIAYHRLHQVDDGFCPPEEKSIVVVAENDHGIIGRGCIVAPAHVEGVWVHPAWRNGYLLHRIVAALELEARAEGINTMLLYAIDSEKEDYAKRLGYTHVPLSVWRKDLQCLQP